MELSQEEPPLSLRDQIVGLLLGLVPAAEVGYHADAIMQLLMDRGYYLPGAPPAAKIFDDAKSFAERLTLSNLALRLLNMLAWSKVGTAESKPARRWLDDYLEGKNHGPVGKPMLWPRGLPGIAHLLTQWGFEPTPTNPAFVARSLPHPTLQ